ncbi:hypothetical protein [Sphingomonas sp. CFBP 13720]|uniref:hypothetical protein n=1 Tax=Sphingomonas sp. CFBP 13720 TaxID=2775302 RepID=UPI001784B20B|nr:hypothetical protein [Sphingomonas sp. CFBP 13720]MBD8678311.1 hypothetical protein [Sphingomonas sp. CFBP 13720]
MANPYQLREPVTESADQVAPFSVNENGNALHEVLRLLLGTIDVYNPTTDQIVKLRSNEFRTEIANKSRPEKIVNLVLGPDVGLHDYIKILNTVGLRNATFFRTVRSELVLCLLAKKQKRYTESFLYLYRILEYVSVAFPMLYALSHQSFVGSHNFLKSIALNGKEGDLKILEKTIPILSAQGNLTNLTFDFCVEGIDVDCVSAIKNEITNCVKPAVPSLEFETEGDVLFRVPFDEMSVFFATIRNRMFHYRLGEKNINWDRIGGSETICRMCGRELIYWFALLYTEIIRVSGRQVS